MRIVTFGGRWPARFLSRGLGWTLILTSIAWVALEIAVTLIPYPGPLAPGPPQSLRILDRSGHLLAERVNTHGNRVRWVPLDRVSPRVIQATIAVEDQRFWDHGGVDPSAVVRAIGQNLAAGRIVSGASTLTMQVVRLVEPHPRGFWHKAIEAFDAHRMERALAKREIIEQYLNRAPYGAGAIGIEAASRRYFDKPGLRLSLAEAALLAGLPQGPSRLDPLRHPARARARQAIVLTRMRDEGFITERERAEARAEPLRFVRTPRAPEAMHFGDALLADRADRVAGGGDVRTTLDRSLQRDVEVLVRDHVEALASRGLSNAAVVVLDNTACEVLAMVGSVDYWRETHGAVDGARALRQPGSTLKPFAYALAFEQGHGPASIVADIPTTFVEATGRRYSPRNYAGRFHGPVMMGEALARSLNVTAIRIARMVGPGRLLARLRAAGLTSLDRGVGHYGLGLVLGNGEVRLTELAQAYAVFPRGGLACTPKRVLGAPDVGAPTQVFEPHVAELVTHVLADERLRMMAFGSDNVLMLGFPMAIKTGTSQNWRDSWVIGYTGRYTIAVWAGDFENQPMHALSGITGAGPLFHRVARRVIGPPGELAPPLRLGGERAHADDGSILHDVDVCPVSGRAPTPHCPAARRVRTAIVPGALNAAVLEPDPWMRPVDVDVRNGLRAGPGCPREHVQTRVFAHLPPEYAEWQSTSIDLPPPPSRDSPLCPGRVATAPDVLRVTHPAPDDVFLLDPGADRRHQRIALEAIVDPPLPSLEWFVDGARVSESQWPYTTAWTLAPGWHTVEVVGLGARSDPVAFLVR